MKIVYKKIYIMVRVRNLICEEGKKKVEVQELHFEHVKRLKKLFKKLGAEE